MVLSAHKDIAGNTVIYPQFCTYSLKIDASDHAPDIVHTALFYLKGDKDPIELSSATIS